MNNSYIHISFNVLDDCINIDSMGEICLKCNTCGRWDRSTQKICTKNVQETSTANI